MVVEAPMRLPQLGQALQKLVLAGTWPFSLLVPRTMQYPGIVQTGIDGLPPGLPVLTEIIPFAELQFVKLKWPFSYPTHMSDGGDICVAITD